MRPSCLTVDIPLPPLDPYEREAPITLQDRLKAKREGTPLPPPVGGKVESTSFLNHVLGQGAVARWHYLSRPEFHAVHTTQYVPRIPTEEEVVKMFSWGSKRTPEEMAFLVTRTQKQAQESVCGTSLLFQTLHDAYDKHLPVSLAPEVLWYAICHEVAYTVKQAPAEYAHLFTTTPDKKQKIVVEVPFSYEGPNDWAAGIQMFDGELRDRVPDGIMDHILPTFSTSTQESDIALLIAFMDAASPYYEYGMFTCCGIPRVRLEGVPDDWKMLVTKAQALSEVFSKDLGLYFEHLIPVLATLSKAAQGEDVGLSFWKSMVKVDGGSGGPYVSGWLTTFWNYVSLAKGRTVPKDKSLYDWKKGGHFHGLRPDSFTSHVTRVDFEWNYYGRLIPMGLVSGVIGVEMDGDFLCPRLGFGVIERAPATP